MTSCHFAAKIICLERSGRWNQRELRANGRRIDPKRIGAACGTRFWYHGLRNAFITVAERELMMPPSLTKRLLNHAPPRDITQSYAADWTIGQLREPAQRIADRIEALMMGEGETGAEAA
ncbi:MAG: hypothetical protein OXE86_19450 [Alphaproteobacteria bacterium]|nr:hypothetical protein [Alphaproteobacteria bacterium]